MLTEGAASQHKQSALILDKRQLDRAVDIKAVGRKQTCGSGIESGVDRSGSTESFALVHHAIATCLFGSIQRFVCLTICHIYGIIFSYI